ncbi:3-hydroxybutyryl-CoA dehydrogenase [Acinetobacter marinus]|uniref:3-hydroxybutyryl-CoA dehydrogenase n=1 Tax=Acinetobacter marinus TaxID=281375 RepID=A0A1G6MXT3_9GAMM|nr:3-hydroxyacyl-CoA dehydrogenase [Acinetobacter marinus]SDC60353.1 3-hydroxybutyryl-CoA dehydrogenase [Acinetobacter marinus]
MNFKQIMVAGSGVLGYQIAFQTAFHGFKVTVYDVNDQVLDKAKAKFHELSTCYQQDMQASQAQLDATFANLSYQSDLALAVQDADLVIEAVPEDPSIKRDFYEKLAKVAPEKTIFATNTSTLLPSQFAEFTGRPEKFLALHFANRIWKNNTAEIMGHQSTDAQVYADVVEFAKAIGMLALPLHKEQPGFIINTLLVPFLVSALELWVNDVADPETIDKTWMKGLGNPMGPFAIIDMVGITTAHNVAKLQAEATQSPVMQRIVDKLKTEMIDQGNLGTPTGKGFYSYPNPAFEQADFLKD